jgi:methionyl aminopeptidase
VIVLKNRREIALMRDAGRIVSKAISNAAKLVRPGVRTREIDAVIEATFRECGAQPLFRGLPGVVPYPAISCVSVNEEVVHGVPGDRALQPGDLVSIDTGCRLSGWCADSAWTYSVGPPDDLGLRLLSTGQRVLELAIAECGRKQRWSEVAALMAAEVQAAGFTVVEDFVGHGIGREMHEDPQVPNHVSRSLDRADFALELGLVLAIEPILTAGTRATETSPRDHWTVVTADRRPSVHFEHTVALTEQGPMVLTERETE